MLHTNPSASSWEDIKQTGGWSHGICGMCGIYDMAILRSPIVHLLRGAWCWWGEAYHHRIERYSWPQRLLNASWRGAPASARDKFYQFLVRITSQNDPNFEDPWLTSCGHANPRRHLGNWRSPISVDGEVRNFKNDWDLSSKGMKAHKKLFRVSKSSICFLESCAMIISITPCHSLWRKHSAQSLPAMARCRSCQAPLEPRLKPRPNSKPWNWSMENLWTHN